MEKKKKKGMESCSHSYGQGERAWCSPKMGKGEDVKAAGPGILMEGER